MAAVAQALAAALLAVGCCSTELPLAAAVAVGELPPSAGDATFERRTARARIESDALSGEFEAVLIAQRGPRPRVRMQLLPELGSKVLDVAVTPERAVGYWPHLGRGFDAPVDALPRGFAAFLATSLLESAAPLTRDRVSAAHPSAEGVELVLRPVVGGSRVSAWFDASGALVRRELAHGRVGWTELFEPHHAFVSRGFSFVLEDERVEPLDSVPEGIFELELPEGVAR